MKVLAAFLTFDQVYMLGLTEQWNHRRGNSCRGYW